LFVHRPCARDKADLFYFPSLALYHRTYGAPEGCVLVLDCTLGPDEVSFTDVGHPFVFQNTKVPVVLPTGGRTVIPSGRIHQKLSFTTVSFGIPSLILLSSPVVRGWSISWACAGFHIVSCVRFRYCISLNSGVISSHTVWSHFSPETHKNFHSGVVNHR
jgi:hypothetical protein